MKTQEKIFTQYDVFVIAIMAILQFTIILDFMVLSPLGVLLMRDLKVSTSQFGSAVSGYAFSAGISGLLTAGFADKFDRKKLLLFFYTGFIVGTILCGIANTYTFLLLARIVTGIFGGVIGSISFAIITDMFKIEVRGRVMGFVQTAFAASQVLGLPIGLVLANHWGWHAPFLLIASMGIILGIVIVKYLRPVTHHLHLKKADHNAFAHLLKTVSTLQYLKAFLATIFLAIGGFMLMPFGSAFSTHNLGIRLEDLPILYGVTGVASIAFGPLAGKLSDKIGKYKVFLAGSILMIIMIAIYTRLGVTPLWVIMLINIVIFAGITARMVSASSLLTAVPAAQDRGAFMSINSSIQQIAGGVASMVAGLIIHQAANGHLEHYERLGYVVIASMLITIVMIYYLNQMIAHKLHRPDATL